MRMLSYYWHSVSMGFVRTTWTLTEKLICLVGKMNDFFPPSSQSLASSVPVPSVRVPANESSFGVIQPSDILRRISYIRFIIVVKTCLVILPSGIIQQYCSSCILWHATWSNFSFLCSAPYIKKVEVWTKVKKNMYTLPFTLEK